MLYLCLQLLSGLALVGVLTLTGEAVARWLPPPGGPLDRLADRFAAGAAVWIAVLALLASVGLFRRASLLLVAVALCVLGLVVALRARDAGTGSLADEGEPPARPARRWASAPLLVSLGVVLAVLALQALRPNVSWDANVYHLTLPRLMLEAGGWVDQEMLVYSHWPLGIDLLFGLGMAIDSYVTAKLLHFAFGVATLLAAARLTLSLGSGVTVAALASAAVLMNPVVQYEMRIAYVDLAQAFFLATAALHVLAAHRAKPDDCARHLNLAGLCAAAVVSCKLNGFFGLVALLCLFVAQRGVGEVRSSVSHLGRLLAPSLAIGSFWLAKSLLFTGNPIYPLLFGVFGGDHWSARLSEQHGAWLRAIGMGREPLDFVLLPYRVLWHGELGYATFDGQLHRVWVLVVALALFAAVGQSRVRALLVAVAVLFVLWATSTQQMRFLIPCLPLLAAAGASGLERLLEKGRSGLLPPVVSVATALLLLTSSAVYLKQTARLGGDLVRFGAQIESLVVHPVYPWIDNNLPETAKLLLINTNHGFWVRRSYIADSFFEASQIADATRDFEDGSQALEWMAEHGVTHLLIERRDRRIEFSEGLMEAIEGSYFLFRSQDERFEVRAVTLQQAAR